MKKRGQAYLITALILIAILAAFVTTANYSKKSTFTDFYDVAEEINIEVEKVLDYDLINNENEIQNFMKNVSLKLGEDVVIYTVESETECFNYSRGVRKEMLVEEGFCNLDIPNMVRIYYEPNWHSFDVEQSKPFYFLMVKEDGGEKYVYKSN